ncbi:MAG TPA: Fic family protein [Solirubrobacterales bacterium]|nr:Fic family protein [Solirubrobacterales bacterium]
MSPAKRTFSLSEQPEVFATSTATSAAIRRAVATGDARKFAGRLYTWNVEDSLERIGLRNWQRIVAHHFPAAVVVDRSALEAKPAADGSLFLDAGPDYAGRRPTRVPGLVLRPRRGPGPAPGDMPYMGFFMSSRPRALLDNMRRSSARGGVARTLSRGEVEAELSRTAEQRGERALNELRDQAQDLAPKLGRRDEMEALDDLIGAVLGTRDHPLETDAARARRAGISFDRHRVELFSELQAALLQAPLPSRPERPASFPALAFFEAYFSNWIEGTEFELDEAEEIVFARVLPEDRLEDAHDVLGTFDLVNDSQARRQLPEGPDSFLEMLRSHHARMLERRPQARPGAFKSRPNQAGGTTFVAPDLVIGTLVEGYRFYEPLPDGLGRAVFLMFLISEVHPFADGNGRVGRVFMNAALSAASEQRIVIPLSYRDNYLGGLRALSRSGDPRPLIRVLDYAQRYAARIDWSDQAIAERALAATNAFIPPDVAEDLGKRLQLPEGVK